MYKHVRNCLDDILDRITAIENRLNQMEKGGSFIYKRVLIYLTS